MRSASNENMTPTSKRVCSELERANTAFSVDDFSTRMACSQPEAPGPPVVDTLLVCIFILIMKCSIMHNIL